MSAAWMGKGKGDLEDASALFPFAHAPSRNCSLDLASSAHGFRGSAFDFL